MVKRCANCRGLVNMKRMKSKDGQRYRYARCNRCSHENYTF